MKRAVLIGINYFGSNAELSGCINDILEMKIYLVARGFGEISALYDTPADPLFMLKTAPTTHNILQTLNESVAKTLPGDLLYVHYSGHQSNPVTGAPPVHNICIYPVDASAEKGIIHSDTLHSILIRPLALGASLRIVFDAPDPCPSPGFPYSIYQGEVCEDDGKSSDQDIVLISSGHQPTGRETHPRALTWALLKCLTDLQKCGVGYSWRDLGQMMEKCLSARGYPQIPKVYSVCQYNLRIRVDI